MTKYFTDNNFDSDVIEASKEKPVLIDFYADWCGPCKRMAPELDQFANRIGDKAIVGKVNTEESREISAKYRIMSIPTLIIIKNGREVDRMVGMQNVDMLNKAIKNFL